MLVALALMLYRRALHGGLSGALALGYRNRVPMRIAEGLMLLHRRERPAFGKHSS